MGGIVGVNGTKTRTHVISLEKDHDTIWINFA